MNKDNFELIDNVLVRYLGKEECVVIPDGVTVIADNAFESNGHVRRVVIPEGVVLIGQGAFAECEQLAEVALPTTLKEIGAFAFAETALKSIELPAGLVSLGEEGTFFDTKLNSITIPGGVKVIPLQAFANCDELEEVILEEGVEEIEGIAFSRCGNLRSVTIPDTLKTIADKQTIWGEAFELCYRLTTVNASARWKSAHADLLNALLPAEDERENFEIVGTVLKSYHGRAAFPAIPEGITEIGEKAFYHNHCLQKIVMPDSVKKISNYAFACCEKLKSIVFSPNTESIGLSAFWGCASLEQLDLPKKIDKIQNSTFAQCTGLTQITIPGNVHTVGSNAFSFCGNLIGVTLCHGVTNLEENAFLNCDKLATVEVPDTLRQVGGNESTAFTFCHALTEVVASATWKRVYADLLRKIVPDQNEQQNFWMTGTVLRHYWGREAEPFIPLDATEINNWAFEGNPFIRKITLHGLIRKIGTGAFYNSGVTTVEMRDGIREIGFAAFSYCNRLTELQLPKTLLVIDDKAFYDCALTEITIPGSVTEIRHETFAFCKNLKKVVLQDGIKRIEADAFRYCGRLTEIDLPDSVTEIDANAFRGCHALKINASPYWKAVHAPLLHVLLNNAKK